jgi:hypothetical protein
MSGEKLFTKPDCLGCANAICDECDSTNGWIVFRVGMSLKQVLPTLSVKTIDVMYSDDEIVQGLDVWAADWERVKAYRVVEQPQAEPIHAALKTLASEKPITNPKDAIGSVKLPLHLWPAEATALGCLGMLEGRCKYGRNNYIAGEGVIASIYVDAAKRHLDAWFSGEEFNPDLVFTAEGEPVVGLSHLGNALACIAIIVKARAHDKLIDDRDFYGSPGAYRKFVEYLTPLVKKIQGKFADKKPHHYTLNDNRED